MLALEGLRVIDCSQGVPGAFCARQLGDLGADVIKVEPPAGDWLRGIGPFIGDESALFLQVNRDKRGMVLDLKSARGRSVKARLVAGADVLVEGYRPATMARLGLGYEDVSADHPRLIYCSISGYGRSGPLAEVTATELDIQAMVGTTRHVGAPGAAPIRLGVDLATIGAGMAGFHGVMAALLWRERTGLGQHVDTSLLAAMTALHSWSLTGELSPATSVGRMVTGLHEPPDHGFETADGPVLIDMRCSPGGWPSFFEAIGRSDVSRDPRFADTKAATAHGHFLAGVINDTLRTWRFDDLSRLVHGDLRGTVVRMADFRQLRDDPQVAALGMIRTLDHPTVGTYETLNIPWHFDDEVAAVRLPAPTLGQHTAEILRENGLDGA